ncbi:MAG TPA: hypothetical protein PLX21_09000 [Rhodocyclaceae bacterium]|nr:hypothetical protein [Thauera aminoaromatica]HNI82048.1 hypothetical protein [Rhodocyclaceae bacterium]
MFGLFKKAPSQRHPNGYTPGLGLGSVPADVVVHWMREARVTGLDDTPRAVRKGRGLALPDGSALAVLSQPLAAGIAGSAELMIRSSEIGGTLLATVRREGEGRYTLDGDAVVGLHFERTVPDAVARTLECPPADFGGIWDLMDADGTIARDIPFFDGGRGQATSTIEIHRQPPPSALTLPLLVLLLLARATLSIPAHPQR